VFVRANIQQKVRSSAHADQIHAEKLGVASRHVVLGEEPFAPDRVADLAGHVVLFSFDLAPLDMTRVTIG